MNNTLLVAWREFRQHVRSRGFILTTMGMPLLFIVLFALTGFTGSGGPQVPPLQVLSQNESENVSIGYVDQAGLIETIPQQVPAGMFQKYSSIDTAAAALESGKISAYYIIPSDYRDNGDLKRVSLSLPLSSPDSQLFDWILVSNLFPNRTSEQVARYLWPFNNAGPSFVNLSSGAGTSEGVVNSMMPFFVAMAVMVPLFTSGGYLLQSLTKEKSSRVMEILLVSLHPRQLLTGKLIGLGALTLVQYIGWIAIAGLAFMVTGGDATQVLGRIDLSISEVPLVVLYALGGFTLYAALMAGFGAMAPDIESSRAWIFIISLPMLIPVYLWSAIAASPNGTLAIVLSVVPFSAPIAMLMRMTSTTVPMWQITVSLVLIALTSAGTIWLMARLFRMQTLLSGESLSIKRLWTTLKGS
jgi:ABC-2 type transport system permease protein